MLPATRSSIRRHRSILADLSKPAGERSLGKFFSGRFANIACGSDPKKAEETSLGSRPGGESRGEDVVLPAEAGTEALCNCPADPGICASHVNIGQQKLSFLYGTECNKCSLKKSSHQCAAGGVTTKMSSNFAFESAETEHGNFIEEKIYCWSQQETQATQQQEIQHAERRQQEKRYQERQQNPPKSQFNLLKRNKKLLCLNRHQEQLYECRFNPLEANHDLELLQECTTAVPCKKGPELSQPGFEANHLDGPVGHSTFSQRKNNVLPLLHQGQSQSFLGLHHKCGDLPTDMADDEDSQVHSVVKLQKNREAQANVDHNNFYGSTNGRDDLPSFMTGGRKCNHSNSVDCHCSLDLSVGESNNGHFEARLRNSRKLSGVSECHTVESIDDTFTRTEVLGEGTYGVVYKARRSSITGLGTRCTDDAGPDSGVPVALKKLRWESHGEGLPATSVREVYLLRALNHPNVVKLLGVYYETGQNSVTSSNGDKTGPRLFLEFEYLERDLRKYMKTFPKRRMPLQTVRSVMWQIFQGLNYCHDNGVIHRDIKPNNILLQVIEKKHNRGSMVLPRSTRHSQRRTVAENTLEQHKRGTVPTTTMSQEAEEYEAIFEQESVCSEMPENNSQSLGGIVSKRKPCAPDEVTIKLADFGLARLIPFPPRPLTHEVVTLWYRAPEILLGLGAYTVAVDMWAAGCVFIELLYGRPIFAGDVEIDTLYKIFQLLGTPDKSLWPEVTKLPHFNSVWPNWKRRPDRYDYLRHELDDVGKDLLDKLLTYDPARRITAAEALRHPWFAKYQQKDSSPATELFE